MRPENLGRLRLVLRVSSIVPIAVEVIVTVAFIVFGIVTRLWAVVVFGVPIAATIT